MGDLSIAPIQGSAMPPYKLIAAQLPIDFPASLSVLFSPCLLISVGLSLYTTHAEQSG